MGATGRSQVRSAAVILSGWKPLTCGNVLQQRLSQVVRSVRIEVLSRLHDADGGWIYLNPRAVLIVSRSLTYND